MRVLVVDDTRTMRMIVSRSLKQIEEVEEVIQAESAEEAIDLLETEPVDLIVCDWNLGGMTGIEFLEALRAAEWTVPFGFITAESSEQSHQRAAAAGAAFILTKPFTNDQLQAAFDSLGEGSHRSERPVASGEGTGSDRVGDLEDLLAKLCAAPIHVEASESGPDLHSPRYVATYADENQGLSALCILETSFGIAVSAAMTRLSPRSAQDWVHTGIVPDELIGDLHEVANVLGQFVRPGSGRVLLEDLEGLAPGERYQKMELVKDAPVVEHFDVDVDGYAKGLCTVISL
jgi:CheY-like chemotaxis protein